MSGTITIPGGGSPPAGTNVDALPTTGGAPVSGAVDSNGDGGYSIGGLAPGGYTITASAPGFGDAVASVTVVGTTPVSGQALALTGAGIVSGVVTDADTGQPIAGATVSSDDLGTISPVTTAADGSYSLGGLGDGPAEITVEPPDNSHIVQDVSATVSSSGPTPVNVALAPAGSFAATIEDSLGAPLTDVQLTLVGPTFDGVATSPISTAITTDGTGTAAATDLLPGSYDLQVEGSTNDHPFTIGPGSRNPSFTVTVPVARLSGLVENASGNPISGVGVSAVVGGQVVASTTTAADGTYQLIMIRTGPVDIVAASPAVGILSDTGVNATLGSPTTVPTLQAGADSIDATVTNGSGPVLGATVTLAPSPGATDAVSATTDPSGDATLANLTPGTYTVTVGDGSDAPVSQSVVVNSADQAVPVSLGSAGSIAGTVTDASAAPIAGAVVIAITATGTIGGATTTSANGTYQISGLAPGSYSLSISEQNHTPAVLSGITVVASGTAAGNASLASAGSTLTLSLSAAGGTTVLPTVAVTVEDSNGVPVRTVGLGPARGATDSSISQTATDLAPGQYTLVIRQPGAVATTQQVTLASGGTTVDVTAPESEALVSLPANEVSQTPAPVPSNVTALDHMAALLPRSTNTLGTPTLSSGQLFAAWLGALQDLPQAAGADNEVLAARVQADLNATVDPDCLPLKGLHDQIQALESRKNADLQNWIDATDGYKQSVSAQGAIIATQVAGLLATITAAAASINAIVAATSIVSTGSTAEGLASAAASFAGLLPAVTGYAFNPSTTTLDAMAAAVGLVTSIGGVVAAGLGAGQTGAAATVGSVGAVASGVLSAIFSALGLVQEIQTAMAPLQIQLDSANQAELLYRRDLISLSATLNQFESGLASKSCPPPPDPPPPPPGPKVGVRIGKPGDPNGITGPAGYSSPGPQWVAGRSALPYVVNFQNEPTATAPAVQVVVTEPVPADIDPDSVQLTGFGFGASTSVTIAPGQQSFSRQFTDLSLPNGDDLDVSGVYDPQAGANGVITWTFSTIDPSTGDLDGAVNAGFLPPDDAAGDGEGFVSWTGSAKLGLATGTTITGQASIVFDRNPAISTPVWTNTVDAAPPTASMTPLPATSTAGNLDLSWSGHDGTGSGVASYDVYESTDGGPLTLILPATTLTSTQVPIVAGHTYGFAVDATDNVGNRGAVPTAVQTTTSAVPVAAPPSPSPSPPVPPQAAAPGYSLVATDGGIFNFGGSQFYGSTGAMHLNKPIVGMAPTPGGKGYWLVASDGGIFNYGDAHFYGSAGAMHLNKPIVGMAATPDGGGYWLVASDGGIFNYGDAKFHGSAGGTALNKPIVGMAATPDGGGYWLVASDGGIFNYGDAKFHGSAGGTALNEPIVGMAATPDGGGYWLVASDGGIFNYGDAKFHGSAGGTALNEPIVGMASTSDGGGYWLVASDGGIFNYGDAKFSGSTGGTALNEPVVGMAAP